jgi:mono/diheme cytochrome c family protein
MNTTPEDGTPKPRTARGLWWPAAAVVAIALVLSVLLATSNGDGAPSDLTQGAQLYATHCASCHGADLEGQPDWRRRKADGRLPAPPHDDSGHTWHHDDELLFEMVKYGLVPPRAPEGYRSDMPAYADVLSDAEIRTVLAYIASRWSDEVREMRAQRLGR